MHTATGVLPPETPAGLARAGTVVDGVFLPGFIMYGIPIGDSRFVKHKLSLKLEEVAREVEQVITVLQGEGQAIWSVIRSSTIMKLDYHLALCYPSDMAEAAAEMDQLLHNMVEAASGLTIPRVEQGRGVECCLQVPVTRLQGRSYQDWVLRLPVRLGGMGVRSMAEVSLAAYIGSVEQALPHFLGVDGMCQQLATVLGDMSSPATRWRDLIASGCRTGTELQQAWSTLQEEALQSSQYLGRDLGGPLQKTLILTLYAFNPISQ